MLTKEKLRLSKNSETRKTLPRNKGNISNSITKNWTDQAIACYRSNCNCTECSVAGGNYSFVCQMPKVVQSLLKEIGNPELTVKPKKLA
ncbi:MAG: hypothetical protein PHX18_07505 [Candidatus Gastranaerophilales bacterium]|nr:hypothetical protein [Candidatus Gastranaerophilales bacterium]